MFRMKVTVANVVFVFLTLTYSYAFQSFILSKSHVLPTLSNDKKLHPRFTPIFGLARQEPKPKPPPNGIYGNFEEVVVNPDVDVGKVSTRFWNISWFSWWSQVILSIVSSVVLAFANAFSTQANRMSAFSNGFFFAGTGLFFSAISIFWTWGYTRYARRLYREKNAKLDVALSTARRLLRIGAVINIVGMFVTIVGAEQIVGQLVAKVLSTSGFQPLIAGGAQGSYLQTAPTATLQALDIFVVQANTNTLLSHLLSLTFTLWLNLSIRRLIPKIQARASATDGADVGAGAAKEEKKAENSSAPPKPSAA